MQRDFDVIVLGADNAGIAAATRSREAGKSVALVETRDAGGTCPLRGCAQQLRDFVYAYPTHFSDLKYLA